MTDNNKFIPKIPETKTEIVIDQRQQEQAEQKKPITEKVKEAVVPTVHASDPHEEEKEGAKQITGGELVAASAIAPPVGIVGGAASGIIGSVVEGVGKATGNENLKDNGEVLKEAPKQPFKEVKKAFE